MNRESMKIGVVGCGAVGSFYGLMLKQAGEDVHFHLRGNYEDVKKHGFSLIQQSIAGEINKIKNASIYRNTNEIGVCDWVIIATKATANSDIPGLIAPMVGEKTSFLTLQNGMGNVENLAEAFGKDKLIVGGLCFTCINRINPTTIKSLLAGYVQFGQIGSKLSPKANRIVDCFENAGLKVRRADSLDDALWRKLCWNVPFNGLCIVGGGITTDLVLSNFELRGRAENLMQEIQSAAQESGVIIEDTFLEKQFSLTEPMGPYKPSSLIDFLAGKPIEIQAIWGEPLRRGQEKGALMPELEKLFLELKHIAVQPKG